jgi:hypothetical protein
MNTLLGLFPLVCWWFLLVRQIIPLGVIGADEIIQSLFGHHAKHLKPVALWQQPRRSHWLVWHRRVLAQKLGPREETAARLNQKQVRDTHTQASRVVRLLALSFIAMSQPAVAKQMTAFQLAAKGNRYIGEQSKNKVVQIRSEKSVGNLTPDIWYVVYYDPDATLKAVEVKFGGGRKMDVTRPLRLLEPITRADEPLPREKLKIDSDKALEIVCEEPLLQNLKLTASRLVLERRSIDDATPVWKIQLWAARLHHPDETAAIGEVIVSVEDGTVLKNSLNPQTVD